MCVLIFCTTFIWKNLSIDIDIDIFVNCNWVDTRWQYTFTHKQYIEHHNQQQNNMNNKQNNTNNKFGRVLAVPSLCELYPGIILKKLSWGVIRVRI
jgi:hypothetical protein